ncbi:MAG: DUF484 family protein [Xanthomonadales bacterium]|nr:DUF484 family protein [Gammaproteobacteria bacterium]MBT8054843.1 DUF484 family protein [Gammaproteobacteria bacterium]NND58524.1 DUF484 family protein [Xanthomonadales bacterium]NNK51108.1 DUF484 family protein [Xanthomonadales bacterium]
MSDDKTSLKSVVASYLRKHPDFLDNNPDVLEALEINHQSGVAASLIERQVDQLRASNEDMDRQLQRLIQVASENEELMSRLHQLTLDLMLISSKQEFFSHLGNSLLNDFNADILQIYLVDHDTAAQAGEDVIEIEPDDPAMEQFQPYLEKSETVCGRLNESKLNFLFGSKARWVQSAALVPLGDSGVHGMMAIGSSDPARFYPGMGTLFLDLLANVIAVTLADDEPEVQRRSA